MRRALKNLFLGLFVVICVGSLIFSLVKIVFWYKDSQSINEQINNIERTAELSEETLFHLEAQIDKTIYDEMMDVPFIQVNLNQLRHINKDTKGWINVVGTKINFPFVQTIDNEYYLAHSFNDTPNKAGWVFVDYRNNVLNFDRNTILYAHGRINGTMFGSLKDTLNPSWYKDAKNNYVRTITEKETSVWRIFSLYRIAETNDYLHTQFSDDLEYRTFLNLLTNRSEIDFGESVDVADNIITLSTCYTKNDRLVLHAKLVASR